MSDNLMATGFLRWLIVISVMLAAVIEVLDMTIVNVALSPMMGALGATRDQITWVLTSYIVSAAIIMPLTGYLVKRFGRRQLLLINISGFLIASLLCGFSHTLTEIVFFRILQGVFGASLIPLSQYVLIDTFPLEERGKAMAIWGMGIMAGPVLGPTLGGYITDLLNWRWIFFVNIPICFLAFIMVFSVIKETPREKIKTDWVGLFWMILAVSTLQLFLDRGQTEDWFNSNIIIILMVISFFSFLVFILRGISIKNNIINLNLFTNRNFSLGLTLIVLFAMGLFSLIAIQPIMLQQVMNYSAKSAGIVMAPRGLTSAFGMLIVARFITIIDARVFLIAGLLIVSITAMFMSEFNLQTSFYIMCIVGLLQGFGIGLFFVPLSTLTFATIEKWRQAEATGLFSFARSLGTSIGISVVSTMLVRLSQKNWYYLSSPLTKENVGLKHFLYLHHWSFTNQEALAYFFKELNAQSSMVSFANIYALISFWFLLGIPLVFLFKKSKTVATLLID